MIYSLRTFKQTGIQEDETIGRRFETILKKSNPEEFDYHVANTLGADFKSNLDNIFGLLYSENVCIPLYKTHKYYVVGENGNTYCKITNKE